MLALFTLFLGAGHCFTSRYRTLVPVTQTYWLRLAFAGLARLGWARLAPPTAHQRRKPHRAAGATDERDRGSHVVDAPGALPRRITIAILVAEACSMTVYTVRAAYYPSCTTSASLANRQRSLRLATNISLLLFIIITCLSLLSPPIDLPNRTRNTHTYRYRCIYIHTRSANKRQSITRKCCFSSIQTIVTELQISYPSSKNYGKYFRILQYS